MEKTFNSTQLMTLDEKRLKNFRNYFFYLEGGFYLLQGISMAGLQVYITYHMAIVFQLNYATIALVSAVIAIPTYLKMFTGLLSDRVPIGKFGRRKPYILFGGILYAPSIILLTSITNYSPIWIVAVAVCYCAFVLVDGTADALTVDITPEKHIGKMQGFANGGRYTGMACGIAVASFLSPFIGWTVIIIIVGFAAVGQAIIMMFFKELKEEKKADGTSEKMMPLKQSLKIGFGNKITWLGIIFGILWCGCYGTTSNLSPLIMKSVPQEIYGIGGLINSGCVAIASFVVGFLISKKGGFSNKNVFIAFIASWVLMLPWLLVNNNWGNIPVLFFANACLGLGTGIVYVCTYGVCMKLCCQSIEGFMFATFTSVFNIGFMAIAPNVTAYFGETLGMGIIPAMFTMFPVTLLGVALIPAINKALQKQEIKQ